MLQPTFPPAILMGIQQNRRRGEALDVVFVKYDNPLRSCDRPDSTSQSAVESGRSCVSSDVIPGQIHEVKRVATAGLPKARASRILAVIGWMLYCFASSRKFPDVDRHPICLSWLYHCVMGRSAFL